MSLADKLAKVISRCRRYHSVARESKKRFSVFLLLRGITVDAYGLNV